MNELILKDINYNKKDVTLVFDKKKITISRDVFLSCGFYVGKTLSKEELTKIVTLNKLNALMGYCLSILKKSHYSEAQMKEKLIKKGASGKEADFLISKLINADLVCDLAYIEDLCCYYDEKNYGKNKIIDLLKKKKFKLSDISMVEFDYDLELSKAKNNLAKLNKKYENKSLDYKKSHIFSALLSLGFSKDIANNVIESIVYNETLEKENIRREIIKILARKKDKDYIFLKLKNSGYKLNDIKIVMEEFENE